MNKHRNEDEDLRDMYLFAAVGRLHSYSRAAEELGVSVALLSRRIAEFERHLGVQLLKRTTRKLEFTPIGTHYFERCQHLVEETKRINDSLHELGATPRGHLRVTMAVDFGVALIAPLLPQFIARYPEISIDCDVSPRRVDLLREQFDVALRLGKVPDSTLVSHPLTRMNCHVYAAPGYLAVHGAPKHPRELATHECVRMLDSLNQNQWTFLRKGDQVDVTVRGRLAINNMRMICRLVADGAGVGAISEMVAQDLIKAGHLVRLFPTWSLAACQVTAVTTSRIMPVKTRVFIDFLREHFAKLAIYPPSKAGENFD